MREGNTNRFELTDRWKQRAGLILQHQPIGFHPADGLLSYPRHMMILLGVILVGLFAWLPTLEASVTKPANQAIAPAPVKITPYEKIEIMRRARREIRGLIGLAQKTDNSRKNSSPPAKTKAPPVPGDITIRPAVDTIAGYARRITAQPPLAIVIANALYGSDLIPASPHAVGGAAGFTRYLVEDAGLPTSRIISQRNMSRGNFVALFGKPGAPAGFLERILRSAPAFELIIYYSGRAIVVDGGKDVVLLTRNAKFDQPGQTGYRLSALYDQLAKLGVKRLRLYLDTAFSNPVDAQPGSGLIATKAVQSAPKIGPRGILTPPDWVVITASSDNQPAYVNPERPSSAFSDVLIAGLRGGADGSIIGNNDSAVTAGELMAFLSDRLRKIVRDATGGKQRPVLSGRRSAILAINEARQPTPAPAPPPPAQPQTGAIAPSFDCTRADTPTEKTICANPAIATLDNIMVDLYKKARLARSGAARRALRAQQKNWLKQRNACRSEITCLAQRYGERIGQLQ